MSTLSERVIEAIGTPPRFTVAEIAEACDVSVQAVYKWLRGDTLKFKGSALVELAALTGYEARWLINNVGPKKRIYPSNEKQAHVLEIMQKLEGPPSSASPDSPRRGSLSVVIYPLPTIIYKNLHHS